MTRKFLIATAVACTLMMAVPHALASNTAEQAERARLSQALVKKWGNYVAATYKIPSRTWAAEMAPAFAEATLEELGAAAKAEDYDSVSRLILGQAPTGREANVSNPKALGDTATDLVFVPIPPCRLFDTRLAGGQIAANTVRGFDVTAVSDYSFQGGAANNCGGAGAAGSFAAAVINFTVVTPSGAGYITAYPFLGTQPLAATLNYTAGSIVGNSAIVQLDQGASANELSVYSFAATHLVADITGYFINPAVTQLQCVEVTDSATINAGAVGSVTSLACAATYRLTGGSCSASTFSGRLVTSRTLADERHFCAYANDGASALTATAYGRCCRVPGR
ncbi:hypothetical protein [Arenimonas sp. MALMAid1274]|uniref:hypothetical protein n=1 Tax=Arenimonas sp. MALMAid1274 TaxID=3411630 RepID=UPI003BA1861E